MSVTHEIQDGRYVVCDTCGNKHGLFYVRSSDTERTLNFLCDKAQHQVWQGHYRILKTFKKRIQVEFVDGLLIEELWTKKYRKQWNAQHHDALVT